MRWHIILWWTLAVAWVLTVCFPIQKAHAEPRASLAYRSAVIREARALWGLGAPVAIFAGQIEQESAWNPRACSAYACGLAQFTPTTAGDMAPRLGGNDVFNPNWAIRALVLYDHDLYKMLVDASTDCDRWAFTLSAYNGGYGNVNRDKKLCVGAEGCNPALWFGNVALHSRRSVLAFRENRAYPDNILRKRQAAYAAWGATISCRLP